MGSTGATVDTRRVGMEEGADDHEVIGAFFRAWLPV